MQITLFRSLLSHWFGLAGSVLIGFFLSPYVVSRLGSEQYGIWALLVSAATQFIVLDFGIRHSLVKFLAERSDDESRNVRLLSSSFFLLLFVAAVGFFFFWLMSFFFVEWFSLPVQYGRIIRMALLLLALDAAIDLVMGCYHGALAAHERWDMINGAQVFRLVLNALFTVAVLEYGWGMLGLAFATFLSRVLYRLLLLRCFSTEYPSFRPRFDDVESGTVSLILRYGAWVFLMTFALRVIYSVDALVVGRFFAPEMVAIYAIALLVVDYFRMLLQSTSSILLPRLSALLREERSDECEDLLWKWSRLSSLFWIGIGVAVFANGDDFVVLWMGESYRESARILSILMFSYLFTVPALSFQQYLLADAAHHIIAKLLIFEAIANIASSVILAQSFGMIGVAYGTVLPAILFRGILLPFLSCLKMRFSFVHYLCESYLKTFPLCVVYYALFAFIDTSPRETWLSFFVFHLLYFVLFSFVYYLLILNQDERAYLGRRLRAIRVTTE